MLITNNQPSFTTTIETSKPSIETLKLPVEDVAIQPPATSPVPSGSSPASVVVLSLNAASEPPSVYEPPVEVSKVRNTQDKSETEKKVSKLLSSNLTSIRSQKTIFSVQNFFSQVGALSRETTSYKNEARSFSVSPSANKTADTSAIDFSIPGGKAAEGVTLHVTTKDGDTIDIQVQHTNSRASDGLSFSFVVTGKLSTEEQDALEKLANKLGGVADDFFRTGTTQLNGLKDFDQTSLRDFHLEFSKPKSNDLYSTMSYDFSIDEKTNTQHLSAKDADNYSIDITSDLQTMFGGVNTATNNSLQAYLKIIRDAMNEHTPLGEEHSNKFSLQFILDSFTSILGIERTQESDTSFTQKAMTAFDTGLPDFNATIKAPVLQKFKNLMLPEAMTLNLMQKTEIEHEKDGRTLIKQTNSFEHLSSKIAGILGSDKGDLTTGNFIYKTINEKQKIVRILDMSEKDINNLITERTSSTDNTERVYNRFHFQYETHDQHSERSLTQLTDDIDKHKHLKSVLNNSSFLEKLKYLSDSTKNLFFLPVR